MSKTIVQLITTCLLVFFFQGFLKLDWWFVAVAGFVAGFAFINKSGAAFSAVFVSVFLSWFFWALIQDSRGAALITSRIGALLPGSPGPFVLAIIASLIGAIPAAFAGLAGSLLNKILFAGRGSENRA